ncbi:hypothetical protein F4823DRAFT_568487 [Ustulina deusta]|nr:hypothetical protein F4823DRAFT_568487 [Ustulina deusta]
MEHPVDFSLDLLGTSIPGDTRKLLRIAETLARCSGYSVPSFWLGASSIPMESGPKDIKPTVEHMRGMQRTNRLGLAECDLNIDKLQAAYNAVANKTLNELRVNFQDVWQSFRDTRDTFIGCNPTQHWQNSMSSRRNAQLPCCARCVSQCRSRESWMRSQMGCLSSSDVDRYHLETDGHTKESPQHSPYYQRVNQIAQPSPKIPVLRERLELLPDDHDEFPGRGPLPKNMLLLAEVPTSSDLLYC